MQDRGSDRLGRWVWVQIPYQNDRNIRIIQFYYPNPKYGLFNTATQQYQALLRDKPDSDLHVRKQFEEDFHKFLLTCAECDIIIMGDFNMSPESKFIKTLCNKFHLSDVITEKLPADEASKSTYQFGRNRIDHVLASRETLKHITNIEIGDYGELNSDHRPIQFHLRWIPNKQEKRRNRLLQQWQFGKGKILRKKFGLNVQNVRYSRCYIDYAKTKNKKSCSQNETK